MNGFAQRMGLLDAPVPYETGCGEPVRRPVTS